MFVESKAEVIIDVYRPQRVLRSTANVKLKHRFTRLTKIQQSPYYGGLELWDKLPNELQSIDTRLSFKQKIKGYKL